MATNRLRAQKARPERVRVKKDSVIAALRPSAVHALEEGEQVLTPVGTFWKEGTGRGARYWFRPLPHRERTGKKLKRDPRFTNRPFDAPTAPAF